MSRCLPILLLLTAMLAASAALAQSDEEGEDEVQTMPNPEDFVGLGALGIVLPGGGLFRIDPIDPYVLDVEAGTIRFGDGEQGARPPAGAETLVPGLASPPELDAEGNAIAIEELELAHEGLEMVDCSPAPLRCVAEARDSARQNATLTMLDRTYDHYGFAGIQQLRGASRSRDVALATLRVTGLDTFLTRDESGAPYTGTWEPVGRRGRRFRLHLDEASEARLAAKLGLAGFDTAPRVTVRFPRGGAAVSMAVRGRASDPATGRGVRYKARLRGELLGGS